MAYQSPYGTPRGILQRLANWRDKLCRDRTYPWVGCGLIADMEAAMRTLREYAEHLRVHGDDEQHRLGSEMLDTLDRDQVTEERDEQIADALGCRPDQINGRAADLADEARKIRQVLEETGALAADDTETDVPALLRALLS